MTEGIQFIEIYRPRSDVEVALIKSILQPHHVHFYITDEFNKRFKDPRLMVAEEDAETATQLLKDSFNISDLQNIDNFLKAKQYDEEFQQSIKNLFFTKLLPLLLFCALIYVLFIQKSF